MNVEAIDILKGILNNYGIDNVDDIIEEVNRNNISNDVGFENSPLKISAEKWLKTKGLDLSDDFNNYGHELLFYPIKKDGKVNKFHIFNSASKDGKTKILDVVNTFDVSDTNYIEKSTGRISIDSKVISPRVYGNSIESNKTSQTIGNIIDETFQNNNNFKLNVFKFKNEKMIEYGKNKIQKQNYDVSQMKHFESFRVFSNLNELQTNISNTGIIPQDLMDNSYANNLSFRDVLNSDSNNLNYLKSKFVNKEFNSNLIQDQVKNEINNYILSYNQLKKVDGHLQYNTYDNTPILFDKQLVEDAFKGNVNNDNLNKTFLEYTNLNKFSHNLSENLTNGQKDFSFLENSKSNLSLSLYDEFISQQQNNLISGKYLNEKYDINLFDKNKNYSIAQIQSMNGINNLNADVYTNLKNTYEIENNKVMMTMPVITKGKLYHHKINLNISETDFKRYMNVNFRQDGNLLVEHFVNSKMDEVQIKTQLNKVQGLIKQYQSGNIIGRDEILKDFSNYNDEIKNLIVNTVIKGNDLNVSNIINRSQSMIKGNSQFFNHSIQGSLSAFNKLGARPWQSLETLDDVLINVSTDLENENLTSKTINITREIAKQKSKTNSYIMDTDFIKNMNLRGLSNAENNFINSNNIETRDTIKGLFFDSYGIIDSKTNKVKHGQLAYNESMYLNKGFNDILQGKKTRTKDYSFEQLPEEIKNKLAGVTDIKKINNIFKSEGNNVLFNQRMELLNTLPNKDYIFLNEDTNSKLNNFLKETGTTRYNILVKNSKFINKNNYLNDIYNLSDDVLSQMSDEFRDLYKSSNNLNDKISLFEMSKNDYSFIKNRIDFFNVVNNIQDDYINLDYLDKDTFKKLKTFQKENRMKNLHLKHLENRKTINVNSLKENLLSLGYNKNLNNLGLDYKDSYIINNVNFNQKTNTYSVSYDDITLGALGRKVHMNDGYKGTISSVADVISAGYKGNNFQIAGINSSKSFSRGFDGGNLYSTIETSLFLGNKYGNDKLENDFFDSLKKIKINNQDVNIFELLGLEINKTKNGYEIFDLNSGLKNYNDYNKLANPDAIDNPMLYSKIKTMQTINKMKSKGIHSFEQLDMIVDQQYNKIFKDKVNNFIPIYGEKEIKINDQVYKMKGKLSLKSLNITGANQNSPYQDALKIDHMTSRFFDSRGFNEIGENIRHNINNRNSDFLSQFSIAFKTQSLNILNGTKNFNEFGKNTITLNTSLLKDSDFINDILFSDLTFDEFIQKGNVKDIKKIKNKINPSNFLRKQIEAYVENIQNPDAIRSIPTLTIDNNDLKIINKNISNTFNNKLNSLINSNTKNDNILGNNLKAYYNTLKEYVSINDTNQIKKLNKNNNFLLNSLQNYKNDNREIFGLNNVFSELFKTNDVGELSKIINLIENPDEAINYNFLTTGVFLDPKTNKLNLNPIKSQIRNLLDLDSYNSIKPIIGQLNDDFISKGNTNLKSNQALVSYLNNLKKKDINKLTNLDLELLSFVNGSKEDDVKKITQYLNYKNSSVLEDINYDIEKEKKLFNSAKSNIDSIINNFNNKSKIIFASTDTLKKLEKSSNSIESKIFRNLYSSNQFLKENLSKKGSFLTDYLSIRARTSFSEQAAEGSLVLSTISNKIKNNILESKSLADFKAGKIYKDVLEIFGEDVSENIIFRNLDEIYNVNNNKIDITKLNNLQKQIENIESFSFVSKQNLDKKANSTFKNLEFNKKENLVNGFLFRPPAQSSENIVPVMNYIIDSDNKENFIIDTLNKNGFGKRGTSLMILGKATAARMKQDNDGDKIYFSLADDLSDKKLKTEENIRLSVLFSNDREYSDERYQKLGFDINSSSYKKIKSYSKFYNALNDVRTKENIDSHFHVGNLVYGSNSAKNKMLSILSISDDQQRYNLIDNLVDEISEYSSIDKKVIKSELNDFIGVEIDGKTAKLKNKLSNPFDFIKMNSTYIKDTNVAKTGIVYTNANRTRNLMDIFSKTNMDENSLEYLAKSIAKKSGNIDEYQNILNQWDEFFSQEKMTKKDFFNYVNQIKNNSDRTSMATFEAIEMGVISGKHGTVNIYDELQRITNDAFIGTKNYNFDLLKKLKVNKISSEDINSTKNLLNLLIDSNVAEDKDLLKILGISLSSKMYQEKELSNVLLNGSLEEKRKIISSLNKNNVKNINLALTMTSEYADNLSRMNKFEKFIYTAIKGKDNFEGYEVIRKNNPIAALGKLFGIDIGRVTKQGTEAEINELLNNQIDNIFNNEIDGYEQILKDDDIIKVNNNLLNNQNKKLKKATKKHKSTIVNNIDQKVKQDIIETSEFINQKQEEKINEVFEEVNKNKRSTQIIDKTKEKFSKLSKKKIGIGLTGMMLLGIALGYSNGRKNTTIDEEQMNDEELGIGTTSTNLNSNEFNNIGY